MPPFKNLTDYFDFEKDVCHKQRYLMSDCSNSFLDSVSSTVHERERIIRQDEVFWRAQLGCISDEQSQNLWHTDRQPHDAKRMKPDIAYSKQGRANPAGIMCLYLASSEKTAMSELRPWLGATISCAEFRTVRDLRIVDCHNSICEMNTDSFDPDTLKEVAWFLINQAYSEPVSAGEHKIDYVPTQIISELFKSKGYDGIAYKSSLGDGYNMALFDLDSAVPVKSRVYETKKISCEFTGLGDSVPYRKD